MTNRTTRHASFPSFSRRILTLALAAAVLAPALPASADPATPTIEGVWRVQRARCDAPPGAFFWAIMTFNRDGTLTGYGVPPGTTPADTSPDFGTWKREPGAGRYSFRLLSYSYDPDAPPPSAYAGRLEVTGQVQVDGGGKTFSASSEVAVFGADGTHLVTGCGRATAVRFE